MSARGISNAGGGTAWGNIFTVQTPYLDNLGKQIYAQEQQRQIQQQRESDLLDQQFSREASNIRDADVNEYADKYNQWKQAKIGLMQMNPRNQKDYMNAQLDANRKLADMSQFSANSIANKAQLGQIGKALVSDKTGEYKDNATDMYRQAMQTPSSKLNALTYQDQNGQTQPYDALNPDQYKYEGNMVNWEPKLSKAEGKLNELPGNSTPITDKNGAVLGTNNTTIKAKNSPLDYYTQLVGSLTGSDAQKSLNATFKFTDPEAQQIVEDYQDKVANNPLAQKAWGDGVKLPLNALLVPATRTAALQSMKYALSNLPQETAAKPVYNRAAIMDKSEQFRQDQQARGNEFTKQHIRLSAGLKENSKNEDDVTGVDAILQDIHDNMKSGENQKTSIPAWMKSNINLGDNVIPVNDPDVMKSFDGLRKVGSTPTNPDGITYDKDKKQFNLIYKPIDIPASNGTPASTIPGASIPLSESEYANAKAKSIYKGKDLGKKIEILSSVINKSGGLYNAQKMYDPTNQTTPTQTQQPSGTVKIQVNGKTLQGNKENLQKLDKAGIKYKVIQ